ncbi:MULTISPECIES: hypothetical protein [Brevibacterium]|uniref:Uncharacterized protein n=3 Tax=Brevibacterium casei TaxID=33889 RepID=K9AE62_9MICO|nr:hypothetical protein [Brevibacterium casei]NJE66489.1 hypothetical protein [Brevibacterium sp. LS14]SIJ31155.1 Uncharacterised protein [Mycobacteroides abscessus subsp. abscessus]EKU45619.1 hypothetical protein C272_13778 [Brevibacterium casei S18]KZE23208.1 hypothetical protein AVW13_04825 [Brevibacterium casei]MBE4693135.1 hypothetical protein [Brevibacterium casei]
MNPKRDRIVGLICGVLGAAVIGIGVFWVSLPALILAAAMAALPIALIVRGSDDAPPRQPWHRWVVVGLLLATVVVAIASLLDIAPLWPVVFGCLGAAYYSLGILLLARRRPVAPNAATDARPLS